MSKTTAKNTKATTKTTKASKAEPKKIDPKAAKKATPATTTASGKNGKATTKAEPKKATPATEKKISISKALNEMFAKLGVDKVSVQDAMELAKTIAPKSGMALSELTAKKNLAWYKSKARKAGIKA